MVNRINVFNRLLPQEKVYLHFDNTAYFMGDKMWFKAYVLRSDDNHATNISRVLYVELLDRTGNVIDTQKLPIGAMGQADGCFDLKNVLAGGFYEVRAYTRYMLNWDSTWLFLVCSQFLRLLRKKETTPIRLWAIPFGKVVNRKNCCLKRI